MRNHPDRVNAVDIGTDLWNSREPSETAAQLFSPWARTVNVVVDDVASRDWGRWLKAVRGRLHWLETGGAP